MKPILIAKRTGRTTRSCARIVTLALLFMGLLLYGPRPGYESGFFDDIAFFTYSKHPDLPLDGYTRGQLGVLEPGYARSYLFVAYRYLAGFGLNVGEQSAALALWNERLGASEGGTHVDQRQSTLDVPLDVAGAGTGLVASIHQWIVTRQKVQGANPVSVIEAVKGGPNFANYVNCTADAFLTAAHTLDGLLGRFRAANDGVKDWVAAQDQVFSNCGGAGSEEVPAVLPGTAPPLLPADRDYQIAAAYFYGATLTERGGDLRRSHRTPHRPGGRLRVSWWPEA